MKIKVRLRSKDGMESILANNNANFCQLKEGTPIAIRISKDIQYLLSNRDILLSRQDDVVYLDMIVENIILRSFGISYDNVVYLYYQCKNSKVYKNHKKIDTSVENQMTDALTKVILKRPREETTLEENSQKKLKPYFRSNLTTNTCSFNDRSQMVEVLKNLPLKRPREDSGLDMALEENSRI